MANVWKIGSRWSGWGAAEASILSIFRRNNVVFVGLENETHFLNDVKKGDYFAIADGYQIVAVAKAVSAPDYIGNLKEIIVTERDYQAFDFQENRDWAVGVRVQIHDILKKDWDDFYYQKRSSFCGVNYELAQQLVNYYEKSAPKFAISSYTSTLLSNNQESYKSLLDKHVKYIVPVYQRPYEWTKEQIDQFIADIVNSFLGKDRTARNPEPMFIGTMQLSEKKNISRSEIQQDIIDGQQRITTLTLFLKELKRIYPYAKKLSSLDFTWLETHVNKVQTKNLEAYLNDSEDADDQNVYFNNARVIINSFYSAIPDEDEGIDFNAKIDDFCDYVLHSLYFVIIETTAGLSKTIQIFNTINNTGLDLNGADLFKVRMYEYLTDYKGEDESAFDKIQEVYQLLDQKNKEHGAWVVGFDGILDIYKNVLITKYNLNNALYSFGWDTFFERLFDSLLGIKTWDLFGPAVSNPSFEISLEEISNVINVRFAYADYSSQSVEALFALNQSSYWSRYQRSVWLVLFQFIYFYRNLPDCNDALERLIIALNKLFFIYSVVYYKQVYEINDFVAKLIKLMAEHNVEDLMTAVKTKIDSTNHPWLKDNLAGLITDNEKRKKLICSLSTFLEEREDNRDAVIDNIFDTYFDVEHIHATADENVDMDETLQNSIGNLALLEFSINRSIQDSVFSIKRERYQESAYLAIKRIGRDFNKWGTEEAEARRTEEVSKMMRYIYEE